MKNDVPSRGLGFCILASAIGLLLYFSGSCTGKGRLEPLPKNDDAGPTRDLRSDVASNLEAPQKQRIALELSGQLRCFRESLPQLLTLYGFYAEDVIMDIFAIANPDGGLRENNLPCLLDILGDSLKRLIMYPATQEDVATQDALVKSCIADSDRIDSFLNITTQYWGANGDANFICPTAVLQYYPRYLINDARKQYADDNNITYDLIIQSRYDLYYYHHQVRPLQFIIDRTVSQKAVYTNFGGDLFFIAKPETMDTLMEVCWHLPVATCVLSHTDPYCADVVQRMGPHAITPEHNFYIWEAVNNISATDVPWLRMHYARYKESVLCDVPVDRSYNERPDDLQRDVAQHLVKLGVHLNDTVNVTTILPPG